MEEKDYDPYDMKGYIEFLKKYPESSWLQYASYLNYEREQFKQMINGIFGL